MSFSQDIKNEILSIRNNKKCCKNVQRFAELITEGEDVNTSELRKQIKEIELLKTNAKRDAIKIIQETEKISKVMIEQAISDVETIMEETTQFEQQQLQIKEELIDFLNSKIDDIRNCFGKS